MPLKGNSHAQSADVSSLKPTTNIFGDWLEDKRKLCAMAKAVLF
jgi:hypothetical protein